MRNVARVIINAPSDYIFENLLDNGFFTRCEENCVKIVGHFSEAKKVKFYLKKNAHIVVEKYIINVIPYEQIVLEKSRLFAAKKNIRIIKIAAKDDDTSEVMIEEMYAGFLYEKGWLKIPENHDALLQFALNIKKLIEARPI